MTEVSLEQVVAERQFAGQLQTNAEVFFRLANTLRGSAEREWTKKHYFQLIDEADGVESFLDDYGARNNRTYSYFRELVASLRGFALAGYSIAHLASRLSSYDLEEGLGASGVEGLRTSVALIQRFIRQSCLAMLAASFAEAGVLGLEITPACFPEDNFLPVQARQRLPRNVDEEELSDERQKIAEVASKFLGAVELVRKLCIRRVEGGAERCRYLSEVCTEERARVYEATVHNLQSAYDTYIKNTVLESQDAQLPRLRGHASAALHLLEATLHLTHFYERHENDIRSEGSKQRIAALVDRGGVQDVILNHLLFWVDRVMQSGRAVAEALLPEYTNAQVLEVELSGELVLHARPVALIVGIVSHHGTPVEIEVSGQRCNAGSILEVLVAVGSHPNQRAYRFYGDERPLRHIGLLFGHGLGESGIDALPHELAYLRSR